MGLIIEISYILNLNSNYGYSIEDMRKMYKKDFVGNEISYKKYISEFFGKINILDGIFILKWSK